MMKILLISPLPPPVGGIATWTIKFQNYCAEHNIPLSIVNSALQGNRAKQTNHRRRIGDEIIRTLHILKELMRQFRAFIPDVVHINTSCSKYGIYRDLICVLVSNMQRVPVILHCRCNIQDQAKTFLAKVAFRIMVAHAAKVLTLNRRSFAYVNQYAPLKTIILPNFIEQAAFRNTAEIQSEIYNVIFVGHVQRSKGVIEIIEAAKQVQKMRFLLLGPVHEEIASISLPPNVSFYGNTPHNVVLDMLAQADVFLFPSYTEGFANALTEAMACGLPVITTDVGANAEMIEDCGGIIVPVGDSSAIVAALKELDLNLQLRANMGAWNVDKVKRCYIRDSVMEKLLTIYADVVA